MSHHVQNRQEIQDDTTIVHIVFMELMQISSNVLTPA